MQTDKNSGRPMAELYREHGVNMLPQPFTNPPSPGQREGQGGNGVEIGNIAMLEAMQAGRFKVFNTCRDWMEEKRLYHRKDGKLVKVRDDLLAASRYAFQSLRFADIRPESHGARKIYTGAGLRNW
jgi:hypothetical protein